MAQDYEAGREAFYHETGMVYKVKVLKNTGDKEWERYNLKVLEVVGESSIFVPSEVGEEFSCEKRRDSGGCSGLWHLLDR